MAEPATEASDHAMTLLEFAASLIGSLAWPAAAVIIAALFRRQIAELLAKIQKLSWGDKVVDFSEKMDELERTAREANAESHAEVEADAPPAREDTPKTDPAVEDRFQRLLAISPAAAVLDAWRPLEERFRELTNNPNRVRVRDSMDRFLLELVAQGVVSNNIRNMALELQNLRNIAAHKGQDISAADAVRFRDVSRQVLRALSRVEIQADGSVAASY